jgi:hypothetical protein
MKRILRQALLSSLEDRVEQHIDDTLTFFQNKKDTFLNRPSATGGWSIAQCLDHLNSYGNYYLPVIAERIGIAPPAPFANDFTSTWLGSYFTSMMDPKTGTKKYKAFKGHIPAKELDAAKVVGTFINQQEELLRLIRMSAGKDLNKIKIPISISPLIRLRLGDVFQFITAHDERHLQQAKRNL